MIFIRKLCLIACATLILSGCLSTTPEPTAVPALKLQPLGVNAATIGTPISIICHVKDGTAKIGNTWQEFAPVTFRMEQGLQTNIPLRKQGMFAKDSLIVAARFEDSGQRLVFCPQMNVADGGRIPCSTLYALEDDYQLGFKRTFDLEGALISSEITCKQPT